MFFKTILSLLLFFSFLFHHYFYVIYKIIKKYENQRGYRPFYRPRQHMVKTRQYMVTTGQYVVMTISMLTISMLTSWSCQGILKEIISENHTGRYMGYVIIKNTDLPKIEGSLCITALKNIQNSFGQQIYYFLIIWLLFFHSLISVYAIWCLYPG